jgi:GNAT superfamily N-acetyltransferase
MFSPMQNWALDMAWKKLHNFDMTQLVFEDKAPKAEDYNTLRTASGIGGPKNIEKARIAMENSLFAVSVYDGDKLIASGRVVGDGGVSYAVTDIMVDKKYQNQGIGEAVMEHIDKWFDDNTDENAFIMLIANKPADKLYSRHSFDYLADHRIGMLRNQKKDS